MACPPCLTESPAGPFHLLFLSAGLYQISQFYMYLNCLLAKNQVSPLRVPSVWVFIYSFINIYSTEHLLCARNSVRCWACSRKQDRHSLCFKLQCNKEGNLIVISPTKETTQYNKEASYNYKKCYKGKQHKEKYRPVFLKLKLH